MELYRFLENAVKIQASDIFVVAGFPLSYKTSSKISPVSDVRVTPETAETIIKDIYKIANRSITRLMETGDDDFSLTVPDLSRFRVSSYRQRGSLAAVIRIVSFGIPDYKAFGIPEEVMAIADKKKGLVLVTGPAGSGKSTTLACVIDKINSTRSGHIITLEEPIEFLHKNKLSIVSQREIDLDTDSYVTALRACLRQAPDVILVGEMRDFETIKTAMTAAETGHLVISTLHTTGAANTIDRIIDVFPPSQQQQIRVQLSMILQSVVSQQLIPDTSDTVTPAFEVMNVNGAVRNMIRENKVHQLDNTISTSSIEGMISMDTSLYNLVIKGKITKESALRHASNMEIMQKKLQLLK